MLLGVTASELRRVASCASLLLLSACGGGGGSDKAPVAAGDISPPDTTVVSGPPAFTDLSTASFSFVSTEPDSTFETSIDGAAYAPAPSAPFFSGFSNGAHTLSVRALDKAGNADRTPATYSWTVAPAPDTSIIGPTGQTSSTTATFVVSSQTPGVTFEYSLDGAAFVAASGTTIPLTGLTDATHQLQVRAVLGGTLADASPATIAWTVDTTPPTANIVFPTRVSYTDANTITVRGLASDATGVTSVTVNGVNAQPLGSLAAWTANVPVTVGATNIVVSVTDGVGNVAHNAATATITNLGPPFATIRAVDIDKANDRIIAADLENKSLVAIDLSTGFTSTLGGGGLAFDTIESLVVDPTNNRALVLDWVRNEIIAVNLSDGGRTIVSPAGSNATKFGTGGIAFDATTNIAYVTNADDGKIIAANLASGGARSVISGGGVGTGPLGRPLDVVVDRSTTPARLLVADPDENGILAVTISNGNRALFSSTAPTGTGAAFEAPLRLRMDAARNRVLVTESTGSRDSVIAVDLATGNRTELAGPGVGTGHAIEFVHAIAVDPADSKAYVVGNPGSEVVKIDLSTLARTVQSHTNVGEGPKPADLRGLVTEGLEDALLFIDSVRRTVNRVDLKSGNRTVVSGAGIGTGTAIAGPIDQAFDSSNRKSYLIDASRLALYSIDTVNGNRTIISGDGSGSGPDLAFPKGIVHDAANGRVLITDGGSIRSIDLATGARSVISSNSLGTGVNLSAPGSLAIDPKYGFGTTRVLVSDSQRGGILTVDLLNGDRALFSTSSPYGTGTGFLTSTGTWFDREGDRLLVLDAARRAVIAVAATDGARTVISASGDNDAVGTGPRLAYPWSITGNASKGIAFVADTSTHAIYAVDLSSGERVIVSR